MSKIYWSISLLLDQAKEQEIRFLLIIFIDKNYFKKENMGQRSSQKHLKFHNFSEIFGMIIPRNTNLSQYTRTIWRNKNMGQSLFKKHSKFQKIDEILYYRMTRFKYVKLGVFIQYQNTKAISKKKNMGQNRSKKLSNFQKCQLSNFTLTWSNEGKWIAYDLI